MQKKVVENARGVICDFCQTYYPNRRCLMIHEYIHVDQDVDDLLSISELSYESNCLPTAQQLLPAGIRKLRCLNCEKGDYVSKRNCKVPRMSEAVQEMLYLTQKYPLKSFRSNFKKKPSESNTSGTGNIEDSSSGVNSEFFLNLGELTTDSEESDAHQFSDESPQKDDRKAFGSFQQEMESGRFGRTTTRYGTNRVRSKSVSIESTTDSAYSSSPIDDLSCQSSGSSPGKSSSDSEGSSSDVLITFRNLPKNTCKNLTFRQIARKSTSPKTDEYCLDKSQWISPQLKLDSEALNKNKQFNEKFEYLEKKQSEVFSNFNKLTTNESLCYYSQKLVGKVPPMPRSIN